jgi:DNA-binding NarL/FixJ family response regulator
MLLIGWGRRGAERRCRVQKISDARQATGRRGAPLRGVLRVVVADSNWVVRRGLRSVLEDLLPVVVAEARTSMEALAVVGRIRPDALLLVLPRSPRDRLRLLPDLAASTRVVVLADAADLPLVAAALRCGAVAFLVHGEYTTAGLLRTVLEARPERVHLSPSADFGAELTEAMPVGSPGFAGAALGSRLSDREREIMGYISRGLSNRQIAAALQLTEKTIKNHVNRIFPKLAISSRAQAIVLWLSGGMATVEQFRPARNGESVADASCAEGLPADQEDFVVQSRLGPNLDAVSRTQRTKVHGNYQAGLQRLL